MGKLRAVSNAETETLKIVLIEALPLAVRNSVEIEALAITYAKAVRAAFDELMGNADVITQPTDLTSDHQKSEAHPLLIVPTSPKALASVEAGSNPLCPDEDQDWRV
jgi:hypothetical protein